MDWAGVRVGPGRRSIYGVIIVRMVVTDVRAAFFVMDVQVDVDGSYMVRAHYLACEDESVGNDLSREFAKEVAGIILTKESVAKKRRRRTNVRGRSW